MTDSLMQSVVRESPSALDRRGKRSCHVKVCVVLGTRPEIIKMSPIVRQFEKKDVDYLILHTGQHYSYIMDEVFFEELKLPTPKINLDMRSGSHAEQTARMLVGIEKVLIEERPNIILVQGDTNTVLAAVLAASKLSVKIGHVEAGLRSHDRKMPEEINRVLSDHVSDYLFAPTEEARQNLVGEGIPRDSIYVTGNTIVDAVQQNLSMTNGNGVLNRLGLRTHGYVLATVHRQENVDDNAMLRNIMHGMELVSSELGLSIVFLTHPRTRERLQRFNIHVNHEIELLDPESYLNFLALERGARLILTDSGGVQEEACILKVPCVTLRENTERPETVSVGANILAGREPERILEATQTMMEKEPIWINPFGDGNASERIVETVVNRLG